MDPEGNYFEDPDYRPDDYEDYFRGFSGLDEITSPYDASIPDMDDFDREMYSDDFAELYDTADENGEVEIDKLKREYFKTMSCYIGNLQCCYDYSNSDLILISNTLDRVKAYIDNEKYCRAALLLTALQTIMQVQIEIYEAICYMQLHYLRIDRILLVESELDDL